MKRARDAEEKAIGRRYTPMNADDSYSYVRLHLHLAGDVGKFFHHFAFSTFTGVHRRSSAAQLPSLG
jgi:hypothetical protein